jgi:hypothetical protein
MHVLPRDQVATMMIGTYWRERAACAGVAYPEMFDLPTAKTDSLYVQARKMCARCQVRRECFDWAKADRAFEGIAGGHVWRGSERKGGTRAVTAC